FILPIRRIRYGSECLRQVGCMREKPDRGPGGFRDRVHAPGYEIVKQRYEQIVGFNYFSVMDKLRQSG
ncbi:MAG: hypothetical protein KDD04_04655, partial [Sinomicrobium sp.]|nr:hypothetical protein [Sinomicrobium sp.]